MKLGLVTEHLFGLVRKQVEDHGLVVWYDPEGVYADAVEALQLPDTTVLRYEGSFFELRWRIDQQKLMDGEQAPRLVVYVPLAQEKTHHALIELEVAGVVMQPGQQPPTRNTRLAVVARNALRGVLGDEVAADVEKQVQAGRLTLADLDALAAKGGEVSRGVLTLVFGTGHPQEIALAFLASDERDEEISKKNAIGELRELLGKEFDFPWTGDTALNDVRQRLTRHVLLTELIVGVGQAVPPRLASVAVASTQTGREACVALAKAWRLHRDKRESYAAAARRVEREFMLDPADFDPKAIDQLETFPAIERALLQYAEKRLLETADEDVLRLAKSRAKRFWCEAEPQLQARWALVASAAEVLLEADRVEQALKKAPQSLAGMIREYAQAKQPWCLLDTWHRNMESRWHNFEPHGTDNENLEKLVIRARQRYVAVGSKVAQMFVTRLQNGLPHKGVLRQRDVFEKYVKPALGTEKVAYVWVDALRFEMGRELGRLLRDDFDVEVQPALAAAPTVTEIGMAALLPGAHEAAKVTAVGGRLALEISGRVIKDRRDRVAFLKERAGVEVFEAKLEDLLPKPAKKVREGISSARLVLVTSQEIDGLCEQDNIAQARRQMDGVLNDLRRGIRVLAQLGVERIVLVSDHGHLFGEELSEDMKIEAPGGETVALHRRVWVGRGGQADDATLRLPLSALGMEGEFDLATPRTFACFKARGGARAYFHGGLSPQEVLIPILVLKPLPTTSRPPQDIKWQIIPGTSKLTTRFLSVQITGESQGLFEIEPPRVRVELRVARDTISQAVSASYGFDESTGDIILRRDQADPKRIDANTVTLRVVKEPVQKTVGLYLLDATTGAELCRLEKIEVAILI